jgi:protein-L-isoaspartate(D-aspartate) O-methyltransferase
MVESQVARRGVRDDRVLMAMRIVPRERFIPDNLQKYAYEDAPLPVDAGQTISQPFVVALMVEALELTEEDRVLEIGAGSGYAAAVLGQIAREVYAVEWHPSLAEQAERRVKSLGYDNVHIRCGDGTLGWQEHAPYDAIVVAAGGPKVPETLREQLALGGRLVIPVGPEPRSQELMRVRRTGRNEFERESLGGVRFVPLVGSQGWSQDGPPQERSEAAPNLP